MLQFITSELWMTIVEPANESSASAIRSIRARVAAGHRRTLRRPASMPSRRRCYDRALRQGTSMNALGIVSGSDTRTSDLRPPFIPSFGFYEVHESKPIDADPAWIIDTVASLDMRTDPAGAHAPRRLSGPDR
ncbi:hypothetical protein ACV229_08205 [Burkholderia sp. MR1-5-21]